MDPELTSTTMALIFVLVLVIGVIADVISDKRSK